MVPSLISVSPISLQLAQADTLRQRRVPGWYPLENRSVIIELLKSDQLLHIVEVTAHQRIDARDDKFRTQLQEINCPLKLVGGAARLSFHKVKK